MSCPTKQTKTPDALPWYAPVILIALTLLAYSNALNTPFIFDDGESILENPSIRNLWNLKEVFFPALAGGMTAAGRPVVSLSIAINYAISGYDVWSYHVFNILIHLFAGLSLFGLVRRTITLPSAPSRFANSATPLALIVSSLWLLHPLQTESVTYIIQRAESLVGLFYILTLYCFARAASTHQQSKRWYLASLASCLLGMASKEVMVSAPLAVLLYDRTFIAGTFAAAWQTRKRYYLSLAFTWIILALLIFHTGGRGGTVAFGSGVTSWFYLLTQCKAIIHYLSLCAWPSNLVLDYGVIAVNSWTQVWPQALLLILLLGLSIYGIIRKSTLGFLGIFFFAVLAPSSSFIPITTQTIAEHRMYLALAPVVTLFVFALYRFAGRWALLLCSALALTAGFTTYTHNQVYRSPTTIWENVTKKLPMNARGHNNYGLCLIVEKNDIDSAIAEYQEAIRLDPQYCEAYYNLGAAASKRGQYEDAIICYQRALKLSDDIYPEAHNNLGNALCNLGRLDEGAQHYLKAIEQKTDFAEPYNNYGNVLQQKGRVSEAIPYFQKAVTLKPDYAEAMCNWGNAIAELGDMQGAIELYKKCLIINPSYAPAQNNIGSALIELGRLQEAAAAFEAALTIDPDRLEARRNLAYVYVRTGRVQEAIAIYRELLRQMPDEQGLRDEIARLEALVR